MNVAQQFMNQLQEGKTTEAIKTIKEALHERSAEKIQEEKQDILESYGFVVKEAKMYYAIQQKDNKKVLDIVDSEDEAEEVVSNLDNSSDYKIVKITKHTKDSFEKRMK